MGCTSSKLDDLPAVALCRERCAFLDEAIKHRYALAEAHMAYLHSLRAVGASLHRFFDQDLDNSTAGPPSPVLNLPTRRKGDPEPLGSPPPSHKAAVRHNHSNSGSHLHFHSDSDSDYSASESPLHHHSGNTSPVRSYGQINYAEGSTSPVRSYGQINYADQDAAFSSYPGSGYMNMNMKMNTNPNTTMNFNFMRNKVTPSVSYEQRPMSPENVRMGESTSSYYPYPYSNQTPNSYSYPVNPSYAGGSNGFFGSPANYGSGYPPPPRGPTPAGAPSEASTSRAPPPPPSPPSSSAWDFLNPFETAYYPPYTPTRDSKVREEEGIPDLEDEDFQQEVVKEVYRNKKVVDGFGGGGKSHAKEVIEEEEEEEEEEEDEGGKANGADSLYRARPIIRVENDPVEYEVHMVEKKLVDKQDRSVDRGNVAASYARALRSDSEVVQEIQIQFNLASDAGNEIAKILEVGKFPYKKNGAYQVSSKMLHAITPSLPVVSSQPSTSKNADSSSVEKAALGNSEVDDDVGMRSENLSSTLHKLYLWEKKLYEEVKVEEKMRVIHERKCRKLKEMDERGAEAHKVDATRILVRSLSTKIRIAIQVVDKISVNINNSRDDELWPQLNGFIQGLTRMWKSMLECHRSQCQAIVQARRLDAVASHKHFSDAHLEATLQLEHELLNWTSRFSRWVGSQKGYVRAMNNWLLKCLLYEPEETADGVVPFSPGRIGAPIVFVVCNQWAQTLDRISEKEVVDSMRDFATSVLQLWERDKVEMRRRIMMNKDMEKKVKILEREDLKIQKEIQALDKRMVMVSGDGHGLSVGGLVYQSDTSKTSSLQVGLQHVFEAMERFTANSLKAYEELLQRIEEDQRDRLACVSEEVS